MSWSKSFADRVTAHYFEELSARFNVANAASAPLTIATLLIAADATILLSLVRPFSFAEWLVLPPTILNLVLLVAVFSHLARLHAGYVYDHTATMGDFVDKRNTYALICASGTEADDWAAESIVEQYAACATVNARNNERKAWHLHRCWTWLMFACASFAICAGAYVNYKWQPPNIAAMSQNEPQRKDALNVGQGRGSQTAATSITAAGASHSRERKAEGKALLGERMIGNQSAR